MENLEHVLDYRQVFGRVTVFQGRARINDVVEKPLHTTSLCQVEMPPREHYGGSAHLSRRSTLLCSHVSVLLFTFHPHIVFAWSYKHHQAGMRHSDPQVSVPLANQHRGNSFGSRLLTWLEELVKYRPCPSSSHAAEEDSDFRLPYATFFMRKESLLSESGPQQCFSGFHGTNIATLLAGTEPLMFLKTWVRSHSQQHRACARLAFTCWTLQTFFLPECACLRLKIFQRSLFHSRTVVDDVMIQDEHCQHYSTVLTLDDRDLVYAYASS
ncbi:uncharacterized protein EDB91DRAFT_1087501 [Suillus paluster]|uniref:uncharacterized protein n=1 Tax=Suillus paluster TaxID=48578 RepID=UPI001B8695CB|nr:uncharacterized protein EDB91DRAFT_1087501 [Suillus paluster]KAG1724318.1 hypothetical protein EDB91DRAFT_1087501 [Suillus paluster]